MTKEELLEEMLVTHKISYLPELFESPKGVISIDQAMSTFRIWLNHYSLEKPKEKTDKFYMGRDYMGECPECKKFTHIRYRCDDCA